jgi:hypothetical protein
VHDALARIAHGKVGQTKFAGIAVERLDLQSGNIVFDAVGTVFGGHVMVGHR